MGDDFELKRISEEAVERAVERAEHYRLLNDPGPAESICLDVLEVDPENQRALVCLVLALTDRFAASGSTPVNRAKQTAQRLRDPYERTYYLGIIHEREGRAFLTRGKAGRFAYEALRDAMASYEEAEKIRPAGNDDALLRYNSCIRTIRSEGLEPVDESGELPLE